MGYVLKVIERWLISRRVGIGGIYVYVYLMSDSVATFDLHVCEFGGLIWYVLFCMAVVFLKGMLLFIRVGRTLPLLLLACPV